MVMSQEHTCSITNKNLAQYKIHAGYIITGFIEFFYLALHHIPKFTEQRFQT